MKDGVSVIMPAFNEEKNLTAAVADATIILKRTVGDYEIIIVNDGSTDATGVVAKRQAAGDRHIRVFHNRKNMGLGNGLRKGVGAAKKGYVTLFPSDNEMDKESFRELLAARKSADLVISYIDNPSARSISRRFISAAFVKLMNTLFGLKLRYFTGPFIAKTRVLRAAHLFSDGVTILAELRVRLLSRGASFKEIPFTFRMREYGRATLFRWKTVRQTVFTIFVLLWDRLSSRL